MEDYTVHSLQVNSQGKKRLTQVTVERVVGGHTSGISSTTVIIHSMASPFVA
jgi:hypothetical protein